MTPIELNKLENYIRNCVITVDGRRIVLFVWRNYTRNLLVVEAGGVSVYLPFSLTYDEALAKFLLTFNVHEDE